MKRIGWAPSNRFRTRMLLWRERPSRPSALCSRAATLDCSSLMALWCNCTCGSMDWSVFFPCLTLSANFLWSSRRMLRSEASFPNLVSMVTRECSIATRTLSSLVDIDAASGDLLPAALVLDQLRQMLPPPVRCFTMLANALTIPLLRVFVGLLLVPL